MTVADDTLELLRSHPSGLSDAELARRLEKEHQSVNSTCRKLEAAGQLMRVHGQGYILNRLTDPARSQVAQSPPERRTMPGGWPSESAVQSVLVTQLTGQGWRILRVADTESRERGVDVIAEKAGVHLLAEVKGYPGTTYARGEREGQLKAHHPSTAAGTYFAQAILTAMRLRGCEPAESRIVIALPDVPRYRSLAQDVQQSLAACRIETRLLSESEEVAGRP